MMLLSICIVYAGENRKINPMRLATARVDDTTVAARVEADGLVPLPFPDVAALLASDDWHLTAERAEATPLPAGTELEAVIPKPEKIFCCGLNYRRHAEEAGLEIPTYPTLFSKYWRTLMGPGDPLRLPPNSEMVDWETELAVVIGRECRSIEASEAPAVIGGYTVLNDISMRDWQRRTSQWDQGKNFEATNPVGPHLVTLDELPDPEAVPLRTRLDGEVMQESNTSDLIFSAAELVAYISQFTTLVPGDLIATGTPSGVGGARKPPVYLEPGQTLVSEADGIGTLTTPILGGTDD
jgi:acylpyruvate hydrolase